MLWKYLEHFKSLNKHKKNHAHSDEATRNQTDLALSSAAIAACPASGAKASDYTPEELAKKCPIGAMAMAISQSEKKDKEELGLVVLKKIEAVGVGAFGKAVMTEFLKLDSSASSLFQTPKSMDEHSEAVIKTLVFLLKATPKQHSNLKKKIVDLGEAHASKWAVKLNQYSKYTDALLDVLAEMEFSEAEIELVKEHWTNVNTWLGEGAQKADSKHTSSSPKHSPSHKAHGTPAINLPLHEAPLTDEEIRVIEETWKQVLPLGYEAVGRYLYQQMFTLRPEFLQLFSFRMEKDMFFSAKFKHHTSRVVRAVNNAVNNIKRWGSTMVPIFEALGETHLHYKVKPQDFPVMSDCIVNIFKANLKDAFTPQAEAAWRHFYAKIDNALQTGLARAIAAHQKNGGIEASLISDLEKQQASGEASGGGGTRLGGSTLKDGSTDKGDNEGGDNGEDEDEDDGSMTERDIEDVQQSWEMAKRIGPETIGKLLYSRMFELRPDLLRLFSFKDDSDIFSSPTFLHHATRVVMTVGNAVVNIRRRESILRNLEKLGEKHVDYMVRPEYFPVVGESLLYVLDKGLGSQVMGKKTRRAWAKTYLLVSGSMIRGLKSELTKRRATGELTDEEQTYWEGV